jgi:predicted DNA primase small subunit
MVRLPDRRDLMRFYLDHFDAGQLERIISTDRLETREFAFKYAKEADSIGRPVCFATLDRLKGYMATYGPNKAYVGGFYNRTFPEDKGDQAEVRATEWRGRELCFDIDMDHFINVRKNLCDCGAQKTVCPACLELTKEAVAFLSETLEEDFGIPRREMTIIFSGRQGFHLWARKSNFFENGADLPPRIATRIESDIRSALAEYVNLVSEKRRRRTVKGRVEVEHILTVDSDAMPRKIMHRFMNRTFANFFLKSPGETLSEVKELTERARERIGDRLASGERGSEVYVDLVSSRLSPAKERKVREKVMELRYPRYDVGCTKDIHRIMKIPGSIDGSTGNMCVIVEDLETFSLDEVPTIWNFVRGD